MSARDLLPDAARVVTDLVDRIDGPPLHRPSPCAGWRVGDVLNHLVAEHLWAPHLLRGEALDDVGDRYTGDVLGATPRTAWRRAIAGSLTAWASSDPDGTVATNAGPTPADEYAQQMLVDLTVHAWDLARGAGVPLQPVPDAVEHCIAYERPRVTGGGVAGIFAAPVPVPDDAPRIDVLVGLLGRDPGWAPPR